MPNDAPATGHDAFVSVGRCATCPIGVEGWEIRGVVIWVP